MVLLVYDCWCFASVFGLLWFGDLWFGSVVVLLVWLLNSVVIVVL